MYTRNIIIGAIVVLILAIAVWYVFSPAASTGTTPPSTSTSTTSALTASSSSASTQGQQDTYSAGTLRTLVTHGGNYTCSLNSIADSGNGVRGTIYAAGGKTRLDFVVTGSDGTDTTTHIIRNGTYAYTWVDGQTTGTKTAITASSPIVPQQPQGGIIAVTDTAQLSSDCRPWVPEASQFTPPVGITFTAN